MATVNTNAIPTMGVRRVEVLLDGAAALYGTDAVAGVINTVLRSNFEGLSVEAGGGGAEGTSMRQYDFSIQAGRDFNDGRTNISIMGDYSTRSELWARERDYARTSDIRRLVAGTPFEGDTDFDNSSIDTPWGEFIRLTSTYGSTTQGTRVNGQTLTTSSVFHLQPSTNPGCVAPGSVAGTCFDNSVLTTATEDAIVDPTAGAKLAAKLPAARHLPVQGASHEIFMETDERRAVFWKAFDELCSTAGV